jgi:hypothetical protein
VPVSRCGGDAQSLAGFFDRQAREIPQLDDLGGGRVVPFELGERVVDCEQPIRSDFGGQRQGVDVETLASASRAGREFALARSRPW